MLVNLQTIIGMAEQGNYCIPAFNVYNMETVMGVLAAAKEARSPVIMQLYPRLFVEGTADFVSPIVMDAAAKCDIPICFHLDHGPSMKEVQIALGLNATGIMIDGSVHDLETNIAMTKEVVEVCAAKGIGVEGEIGHVGSVNDAEMGEFTDPEEAARFVKETGVTCLAVLIGNAHGHYKKKPNLDIPRVKAIREATGGIPLVLHGGSGIPDDQVKAAIANGVRKMNIGTDVCCAFADATTASLADPNRHPAVDMFMKPAVQAVKEMALGKIKLVGSDGKA